MVTKALKIKPSLVSTYLEKSSCLNSLVVLLMADLETADGEPFKGERASVLLAEQASVLLAELRSLYLLGVIEREGYFLNTMLPLEDRDGLLLA